MSEALDKAKGALGQIKEIGEGEYDGSNMKQLDLMTLARIQAEIAQAEALERMVVALNIIAYR